MDSMRIGIITLSASDNCGSLLQCYALKKLLEPYGNVDIINFNSIKSHQMYDYYFYNFRPDRLIPFLREWLYNRNYMYLRIAEKNGYKHFRHKYLEIRGKELYACDLLEIKDKYDIVVAGSDQIWNVKMFDFDEAFFLEWTNSKKIAVAPSLGGNDIKESSNWKKYYDLLYEFSSLSVREEKGKQSLEALLDVPVKKILDPTLTLPINEWKKLIGKPIVKGDYYFYYSWAYKEDSHIQIVKDMSIKNHIPVVIVDPRKWTKDKLKKWEFIITKKQGPIAFLNYIFYAKRVYVDSFHGMIFSYIFKKDFWLLDDDDMDVRLIELIEILKMEKRVLSKNNIMSINQDEPVQYVTNSCFDKLMSETQNYFMESFQ